MSHKLSLELVNKIFKTVSPAIIFVHSNGVLVGMLAKKDVLRFVRSVKLNALNRQDWESRGNSPMMEDIQLRAH